MNLNDYFDAVEGSAFDANINILSGFSTMLRALANDEILQGLVSELRESPAHKQLVFQRLLELLPQNPNPDYAHPHDVAVAAYLYVLNQADVELGHRAAEEILSTPKLWWARRLARHILETPVADPK
jgi:hypothetical protein